MVPPTSFLQESIGCVANKVVEGLGGTIEDLLKGFIDEGRDYAGCMGAQFTGAFLNVITDRIDSLMSTQIKLNNSKHGVDGYRVQIHHNQSQSRQESQKVRAKFSSDFPHLKTYLKFKSPYYKIQVGNFINKLPYCMRGSNSIIKCS